MTRLPAHQANANRPDFSVALTFIVGVVTATFLALAF
jgi:hypothetical protein